MGIEYTQKHSPNSTISHNEVAKYNDTRQLDAHHLITEILVITKKENNPQEVSHTMIVETVLVKKLSMNYMSKMFRRLYQIILQSLGIVKFKSFYVQLLQSATSSLSFLIGNRM